MSRQLGRISGPLLKDNLLREGHNLAFHNNSSTDNLLYLDVSNKTIGIKSVAATNKDLFIDNTFLSRNVLVDDLLTVEQIEVEALDNIRSKSGPLNFVATDYVFADNIRTGSISSNKYINIDNNVISTVDATTNLIIDPTGSLELFADLNTTGNIHATGTLSADGSVIFGNSSLDSVTFNSDINTDVVPNVNDFYTLGTSTKQWSDLYTDLLNGQAITVDSLVLPSGSNLALRQGKIWYVASNGNDTNVGNHQNGPFATIAKAISVATAGDEIYIYPGTYEEAFPLTVPAGVMIKGTSLRTVIVKPTVATNTNSAFLLNGETTVSDITVTDFYEGHAFRFASGAKTTTRSPYVQNVTVITKGSVTTESDPLGFEAGDAGKGALVDGSVCDADTLEAAMLFHSVTFITPGVDALTMTNGVRVEWLNSFTYYANRSLYATNGVLGLASLGIKFGAEIRSIASASVYGNYGAYADGDSTLMYLIQYNFGYIGAGKDKSNDLTLVVQDNEVTELNSGKIYYQSVDQSGTFRVGDNFYADFRTGTTSISVAEGNIDGLSSITLYTGQDTTYIDATKMDVGNFVIGGNTLLTDTGTFNIVSANGEVYLDQNVAIAKNLYTAGNMNVDGTITLGNQSVDNITFAADINTDLLPKTTDLYTVGKIDKRWDQVFLKEAYVGDLTLKTNTILPATTDNDLVLKANGTGIVSIPLNDVTITNNLTVKDTTYTKSIEVTGAITHVGNVVQTGTVGRTGDTDITGNLTVSETVQFQDIKFQSNTLTTTLLNNDLRLVSAGTKVYIPTNNVVFDQNLRVDGTTQFNNVNLTTSKITADQFTTSDIAINDNYITTTTGNNNLELRAAGTGKVYVPFDDVKFDQKLAVNKKTTTKSIGITGNTAQVGNVLQTGNINRTGNTNITGHITVSGYAQYEKVRIENNVLSSTATNTDLKLTANGTGRVIIPNNNVDITNNLTVGGITTLNNLTLPTSEGTVDQLYTGDILINDNYITTTLTNSDLLLKANGTGTVYVPLKNTEVVNDVTVNGTSSLKNTIIVGTLTHVGTLNQTGNKTQTGKIGISGTLGVTVDGLFPQVTFVNNKISATPTNTDLRLTAAGTGRIYVPSDNVRFNQTLTVVGLTETANISSTGTITANQFTTGDILIDDNYAITTVGNNNLELYANGTGYVALEKLAVRNNTLLATQTNANIILTPAATKNTVINSKTAFKIPVGTTADRTMSVAGELRFTTTGNLFSGYSTTRRTMGGVYSADRLTKAVAHPTNNTITFTANSVDTMDVLTNRLRMNGLVVNNNFLLDGTTILNTVSNSDLTLVPSSSITSLNSIDITDNYWTNNLTTPLTLASTGDGYVKFTGTNGVVISAGDNSEKPLIAELGMTRFNTEQQYTEIYDGTAWIPIIGTVESATMSEILEIGDIWTLILG